MSKVAQFKRNFAGHLALVGLVFIFDCHSDSALAVTGADQFKQFIENPPIIQKIIWLRENLENSNVTTKYFAGSWQPNAAYILQSEHQEDVEMERPNPRTAEIRGRFDRIYWGIYDGALTQWEDKGLADEATNYLIKACEWQFSKLANILNMGITYADVGSIRWNGDQFACTNKSGDVLQGSLFRNNQAQAEKLSLHLELADRNFAEKRKFVWEIRYKYDSKASFLPSSFQYWLVADDKMYPLDTIRILDIQTNAALLTAEYFEPSRHFDSRPGNTYYVKGKSVVYNDPVKGDIALVSSVGLQGAHTKTIIYRILIISILACPGFLIFLWARKRGAQKNKTIN